MTKRLTEPKTFTLTLQAAHVYSLRAQMKGYRTITSDAEMLERLLSRELWRRGARMVRVGETPPETAAQPEKPTVEPRAPVSATAGVSDGANARQRADF